MVRNAKIDNETHRKLSILAAELAVKKGELMCILLNEAMTRFSTAEIREILNAKTYPNCENS